MGIRPFTSRPKAGLRKFGVMQVAPSDFLVQATKRPRGFRVLDRTQQVLSEVRQPSFWSRDMEGTAGGLHLRIASEGLWRARYGVYVQGLRTGTICTAAWATLRLSLAMKDLPPVELQFARTGLFTPGYELRLAKDLPLLELEPVFHWATFLTDHAVRVRAQGIGPEQQPLVLALSGFCARLLRSRTHGGAAS